jgi:hypothetical protein
MHAHVYSRTWAVSDSLEKFDLVIIVRCYNSSAGNRLNQNYIVLKTRVKLGCAVDRVFFRATKNRRNARKKPGNLS